MIKACKKCRREGEKLLLKGDRCMSPKCSMIKRPYGPGQHGAQSNTKFSEYGRQLREKQKIKKIYGIEEAALRGYYNKAEKNMGSTSENLIRFLESRLDNIVYRSNIFNSRSTAKQFVTHGKAILNGQKVTIPSILLSPGDIITLNGVEITAKKKNENFPSWIDLNIKEKQIIIKNLPTRQEIPININESLIVEYYSR